MSDPKPLTKERREEICAFIQPCASHYENKIFLDLLAAEAYWREVVKNATPNPWVRPTNRELPTDAFCFWCCGFSLNGHKPGCPWVKAQG